MKKLILIYIALMLCLCSCAAPPAAEKLHVVSAIFPSYDFAREICGDRVTLTLLIPPGNEIHGYEPSLADIAALSDCDLFLYAGGESDAWTEDILHAAENEDVPVISMLDLVDGYTEELSASMESDHHHEEHDSHNAHHTAELDEHVWTDPENAIRITRAICDALCALDVKNADFYRKNTENYVAELCALDRDYAETLSHCEKDFLVFAERFPFRYLTEAYGLSYDAAFSGCSSDTEPSLATIAHLIEVVEREDANAVFFIEFSDTTVAEMIAAATDTKAMQLYSCQNVTQEDFDRGVTYLQLMRRNLATLKEALS